MPRKIAVYGEALTYNQTRFDGVKADVPVAVLLQLVVWSLLCDIPLTPPQPGVGFSVLLTLICPVHPNQWVCFVRSHFVFT